MSNLRSYGPWTGVMVYLLEDEICPVCDYPIVIYAERESEPYYSAHEEGCMVRTPPAAEVVEEYLGGILDDGDTW